MSQIGWFKFMIRLFTDKSKQPILEPTLPNSFASCYFDNDKLIVTYVVGRQGDIHFRAYSGVRLLSNTLIYALSRLSPSIISKCGDKEIEDQIKLDIIQEWSKRIKQSLRRRPFIKREKSLVSREDCCDIKQNPSVAYDCSFAAAAIIANKLIVLSLGDYLFTLTDKTSNTTNIPMNNQHYISEEFLYKNIDVRIINPRNYVNLLICRSDENQKLPLTQKEF